MKTRRIPLVLCLIGGAVVGAEPRSAATIAAEKEKAQKAQQALKAQTAPAATRPASGPTGARSTPGEMSRGTLNSGPGPLSLLGVVSAETGITQEFVQKRDDYFAAKKELQPKVDKLVERKDQLDQQRSKLGDRIAQLEKQRSAEVGAARDDDQRRSIRTRYETMISEVRDQQDDLVRQKNEATREIERLYAEDPKLRQAEEELNNQIARDTQRYFPKSEPAPR